MVRVAEVELFLGQPRRHVEVGLVARCPFGLLHCRIEADVDWPFQVLRLCPNLLDWVYVGGEVQGRAAAEEQQQRQGALGHWIAIIILKSKHGCSELSLLEVVAVQDVLEAQGLFAKAPLHQILQHVAQLPLPDEQYPAVPDGLAALVGAQLAFLHSAVLLRGVVHVLKNQFLPDCAARQAAVPGLAALAPQHRLAPQHHSDALHRETLLVDQLAGLVSCDCANPQQALAEDCTQLLEERVALLKDLFEHSHSLPAWLLVPELQVVVNLGLLQHNARLLLVGRQGRGVSVGELVLDELIACQLRAKLVLEGEAGPVD